MPDPYRVHNIYTRLDVFASTAREAFAAAGAEPWLEGEPAPTAPAEDAGRGDAGSDDAGSAPPAPDAAMPDASAPTTPEDASPLPLADSGVSPRATSRGAGCSVFVAGRRDVRCVSLLLLVVASLRLRRPRAG